MGEVIGCTTCDWLGGGKCISPESCNIKAPAVQLGLSFVSDKPNDSPDKHNDNENKNR